MELVAGGIRNEQSSRVGRGINEAVTPEAVAVVSGFEGVAAVGQPIEERGCHLCIPEDLRPF